MLTFQNVCQTNCGTVNPLEKSVKPQFLQSKTCDTVAWGCHYRRSCEKLVPSPTDSANSIPIVNIFQVSYPRSSSRYGGSNYRLTVNPRRRLGIVHDKWKSSPLEAVKMDRPHKNPGIPGSRRDETNDPTMLRCSALLGRCVRKLWLRSWSSRWSSGPTPYTIWGWITETISDLGDGFWHGVNTAFSATKVRWEKKPFCHIRSLGSVTKEALRQRSDRWPLPRPYARGNSWMQKWANMRKHITQTWNFSDDSRIDPPVNCYSLRWEISMLFMGKSTNFSWAMFNSKPLVYRWWLFSDGRRVATCGIVTFHGEWLHSLSMSAGPRNWDHIPRRSWKYVGFCSLQWILLQDVWCLWHLWHLWQTILIVVYLIVHFDHVLYPCSVEKCQSSRSPAPARPSCTRGDCDDEAWRAQACVPSLDILKMLMYIEKRG